MVRLICLALCLLPFKVFAQSTPVYLKPNNPAPTGHFEQKMLKKQAISYDQFEWLWVRTSNGHSGWLLKANALLPLDFSRQAILSKGEPIHPEPRHFHLPQKPLGESQVVTLLERNQEWYKIMYLDQGKKSVGWVQARYLSPYSKDAGLFFATIDTPLRREPKMKSTRLQLISAGAPMIPIVAKGEWALVEYKKQRGFIPLQNVRSRMNVAIKVKTDQGYFKPNPKLYEHKIHEIFSNPIWAGTGNYSVELKSKPDMGAKTVAQVAPWSDLILQGYSIKKWGKSHVPQWGELWWPESTLESNVEIIEKIQPQITRLKPSEMYQLEKSPAVPGLQFASAPGGVYRSFDGKNWYPLTPFKNGFPIQVASNGTLFVADKVSFDHGESFQDFVRWDLVFDSMPDKEKLSRGPIQILNVEPHDNNPKQVTLSLRVGNNKYLQFFTPNLGQSWRLQ